VNLDLKYIWVALFFLGAMVTLIKWIGRTLFEISGSEPRRRRETTEMRLERLFIESGAANFVEGQNGQSSGNNRIAEHERAVVAQEASLRAAAAAPIPRGTTSALPHAGRATGVAILLHCPACATQVNLTPTPLPFAAECPGCHRRINARGDGPNRLSLVVVEPRKSINS
jgi:hypothetical protein